MPVEKRKGKGKAVEIPVYDDLSEEQIHGVPWPVSQYDLAYKFLNYRPSIVGGYLRTSDRSEPFLFYFTDNFFYFMPGQAELAVHVRKVEDLRRWFTEAFGGGPSGKMRRYRVRPFLSFPADSHSVMSRESLL